MHRIAIYLLACTTTACLVSGTFDCRRTTQACSNGGICNFVDPDCDCSSLTTKGGVDCGLDTAAGPCSANPCVNGVCYDDAGTERCYCAGDYYGTNCENKRMDIHCISGSIFVSINPYEAGSFAGVAYIKGERGVSGCEAVPVPAVSAGDNIPDTWEGNYIEVQNTGGPCGDIAPTSEAGKTVFIREIVVQYQSDFVADVDDIFTAKCVFLDSGAFAYSEITQSSPSTLTNLNAIDREGEFSPILLDLKSAGIPVSSSVPVTVGDDLTFTLTVPSPYTSLRLVAAEANNTLTGSNSKQLAILDNSCVTSDGFVVVNNEPARGTGGKTEIVFVLRAFHFTGNIQVAFKFTAKVCYTSNDVDCDPVNCNGGTANGFGRKRRSTDDELIIEKIVKVVEPGTWREMEDDEKIEKTMCLDSVKTTAAMIAMGVVVVTLLIGLLITIRSVCIRHQQSSPKEEMSSSCI